MEVLVCCGFKRSLGRFVPARLNPVATALGNDFITQARSNSKDKFPLVNRPAADTVRAIAEIVVEVSLMYPIFFIATILIFGPLLFTAIFQWLWNITMPEVFV